MKGGEIEGLVRVERPQPGLALVTMNRPAALNALSLSLRRRLTQAVDALTAEGEVRVMILAGAGRAFCAGLDLRELSGENPPSDPGARPLNAGRSHDAVAALRAFPGPIIGLVQGPAVTGGLELAMACDLLLAGPEARFADTHGRVGVIPGWGLSQKLARRIGELRAKEMSFTGNFIDAAQAERWGLVNRVVPTDQLMPEALALAADMLAAHPEVLRRYKQLIDEGLAGTLHDGLQREREANRAWAAQFDATRLAASREAVQHRGRAQQQSQAAAPLPQGDT